MYLLHHIPRQDSPLDQPTQLPNLVILMLLQSRNQCIQHTTRIMTDQEIRIKNRKIREESAQKLVLLDTGDLASCLVVRVLAQRR